MKRSVIGLLVFVFLQALPLLAQDSNAAIPPCSDGQIRQIGQVIDESGVIDQMVFASERISSGNISDLVAIVADIDGDQRAWWRDTAPELPRCALADRVRDITGRYVDEMLAGSAMLHIAATLQAQGQSVVADVYIAAAQEHSERLSEIGDEFTAMADELSAMELPDIDGGNSQTNVSTYTVVSPSPANVRSEPNATGEVFMTLQSGDTVEVVGMVTGENVNGSDQWYEVSIEGRTLYIHSSLIGRAGATANLNTVSSVAPAPGLPVALPAPIPTVVSAQCNAVDDLNCDDFTSRAVAQAHLETCGDEDNLDGNDLDGLACESRP